MSAALAKHCPKPKSVPKKLHSKGRDAHQIKSLFAAALMSTLALSALRVSDKARDWNEFRIEDAALQISKRKFKNIPALWVVRTSTGEHFVADGRVRLMGMLMRAKKLGRDQSKVMIKVKVIDGTEADAIFVCLGNRLATGMSRAEKGRAVERLYMLDKTESNSSIAKKCGYSEAAVRDWIKAAGIHPSPIKTTVSGGTMDTSDIGKNSHPPKINAAPDEDTSHGMTVEDSTVPPTKTPGVPKPGPKKPKAAKPKPAPKKARVTKLISLHASDGKTRAVKMMFPAGETAPYSSAVLLRLCKAPDSMSGYFEHDGIVQSVKGGDDLRIENGSVWQLCYPKPKSEDAPKKSKKSKPKPISVKKPAKKPL